jgi:hypothetical protein
VFRIKAQNIFVISYILENVALTNDLLSGLSKQEENK